MSNNHTAVLQHYLSNEYGLDETLDPNTPLFSAGLLDSIDVVQLITFLEKTFSITIRALEVSLECFDSINKIIALVNKKLSC